MEKLRAYDLPVRIFHWSFAILFILSFFISEIFDSHSKIFVYHMITGLLMVVIVILRIIWGFIGSKTARFSSFRLKRSELIEYFKAVTTSKTKRYLGHNPASSYAAVIMIFLTLGIGLTGVLMGLEVYKHFFKDIHEFLVNSFVVVVVLHIAGVLFHQYRHKDGMIYSMFNGEKENVENVEGIQSNHIFVAIIFVFISVYSGYSIIKNYNETTGKLKILGTELQLRQFRHK